jgi:LysR family glycine cleavage system transcriptional activator
MNATLPGTRALRTFEAAARHLNFTRAASEVGLTPAAVSYQIKEIEQQLGITLFTRTSRSTRLTPAGALLFEATIDALDILQRAAARARKMDRGTARLRVSTGARFATNWLLPRLPRFRTAHPHLELTFDITDQLRDFDVDDVDVAIRFGAGNYDDAVAERLFATTVVPVCSPTLLASGSRLDQPRDLLTQTLCYVDCEVDGMPWPNWRTWMAAVGVDDFDDTRCIAFSDSNHVVQAVLEGGAIGLVEPAMIASHLADGRLVKLSDVGVGIAEQYAYYLVYPGASRQDSRVLAFREWMLEEIERG